MTTPTSPNPSRHSVPTDLLQKVLSYLATKAYSEVASLVQDIQAHAQAVQTPAPVAAAPVVPPSEATQD